MLISQRSVVGSPDGNTNYRSEKNFFSGLRKAVTKVAKRASSKRRMCITGGNYRVISGMGGMCAMRGT